MAVVSAIAAAPSSALPEQGLLGDFKSLIYEQRYEEAEKLLSIPELRQMFLIGSDSAFLEELLEKEAFSIILETVKVLSKHEISNKYCELCKVIAMICLGDPAGYFMIQDLISQPIYVTYVETLKLAYEHDPSKSQLSFFADLWQEMEFVTKNSLLFAVLKKLQAEALEAADIESLNETDGSETALQDCLQFFAEYMEPHQMGGLCQHLLKQISYFREHGVLMPKQDLAESDVKV